MKNLKQIQEIILKNKLEIVNNVYELMVDGQANNFRLKAKEMLVVSKNNVLGFERYDVKLVNSKTGEYVYMRNIFTEANEISEILKNLSSSFNYAFAEEVEKVLNRELGTDEYTTKVN